MKEQDLIDKNKHNYQLFIKNYDSISNCEKKRIANYLKLKNTFYIPQKSNLQISTFYNNSLKYCSQEILRLQSLFLHFISYKKINIILKVLYSKKNNTDQEIFNIIQNDKDEKHNKQFNKYKACSTWKYAVENLAIEWLKIKNGQNSNHGHSSHSSHRTSNPVKYLDIGCGNGSKTLLFESLFGFSKNNVFGTDIAKWGPYAANNKKKLPFQFELISNNKLNFADNTFDFITCILTLHHIEEMEKIILEIKRILKNGGIFLLIEHNIYTDYDRMIVDIEHLLYSAIYDKKTDYIENPDYMKCYNKYEWNYIFDGFNFISIKSDILVFDNEHQSRYDNVYYVFYENIKNDKH